MLREPIYTSALDVFSMENFSLQLTYLSLSVQREGKTRNSVSGWFNCTCFHILFFFFFCLFRAAPAVYGGSQARVVESNIMSFLSKEIGVTPFCLGFR